MELLLADILQKVAEMVVMMGAKLAVLLGNYLVVMMVVLEHKLAHWLDYCSELLKVMVLVGLVKM